MIRSLPRWSERELLTVGSRYSAELRYAVLRLHVGGGREISRKVYISIHVESAVSSLFFLGCTVRVHVKKVEIILAEAKILQNSHQCHMLYRD